jgi:hypothetical protein
MMHHDEFLIRDGSSKECRTSERNESNFSAESRFFATTEMKGSTLVLNLALQDGRNERLFLNVKQKNLNPIKL